MLGVGSEDLERGDDYVAPTPIVLAHERPFRIGEAEIRPSTREVIKDGQSSIVEPRVMQLLVALHRADGAVVGKDDLVVLCWEGRIVGEDAINRVVSRLRAVAEQQAGGQFRVETITKVGYRLVPTNGGLAATPTQVAANRLALSQPGARRRDVLIAGSALGVAALAGAGWFVFGRDGLPARARTLVDDSRRLLLEDGIETISSGVAKARAATQIAPDHAEPWGLLAYAYMKQAGYAPSASRANLRERAAAAAARADSLEPGQADAVAAKLLGIPYYRNWFTLDQASRHAFAQHPDNVGVKLTLMRLYAAVGRAAECLQLAESMKAAIQLSPKPLGCYFMTLWVLGRIDEAETVLATAYAQWPRYYSIWFNRVFYLLYSGRAQEAAAMAEDVANRPIGIPDWDFDLVVLGTKAVARGDAGDIRDAMTAWSGAARKGTGFAENAAIFAAFNGDHDEAFRMLDALYFNRGFAMPDSYFSTEQGIFTGIDRHTEFLFWRPIAGLRKDPRFASLTRELGLDDYWRRTNSRSLVIA